MKGGRGGEGNDAELAPMRTQPQVMVSCAYLRKASSCSTDGNRYFRSWWLTLWGCKPSAGAIGRNGMLSGACCELHARSVPVRCVPLAPGAIDFMTLKRVVKSLNIELPDEELQVGPCRKLSPKISSAPSSVYRVNG